MGERPEQSPARLDFAKWVLQDPFSIEKGLQSLKSSLDMAAIVFHVVEGETNTILFHSRTNKDFSPSPERVECEGWTLQPSSGKRSLTACISLSSRQENFGHLHVKLKKGKSLHDQDRPLLELICATLLEKFEKQEKLAQESCVLKEAIDAIDEGFIVYDSDRRVTTFNHSQKRLFPSFAETLDEGVLYDDLLRKQIEFGKLDVALEGGENWIRNKQDQLKQHRFTTEQKFLNGETIRLTNYVTNSGYSVAVRSNITELVEAREKAVQSEELSRMLLENAPIPLVISVDGEYRYANSLANQLFEVAEEGLSGKRTTDFYVNLKDRELLLAKLKNSGDRATIRVDIKTGNGNIKTLLSSNTRINYFGEDAVFASLHDITEAERTRLALTRSERQKRDLLELVPDALVVQVDGKIVFVNDSAVRIFKYVSAEEMIGMQSIQLSCEEERDRILTLRREVIMGSNPTVINTRHTRKTGESFYSEMYSKSVIWDQSVGTMNIIKDVSKRRSYEATLIQKEKEMSLAQEIGHFGHWRVRLKDYDVFWSKELYRIHGVDPGKGRIDITEAIKLVDRRDRKSMIEAIYRTADTKETQRFSVGITMASGEKRHMEGSMRPEFNDVGDVVSVFGVSQDVSDRITLEESLRQSQKMEAIGQLTGGVAHDFNNLLAVIQGNAELLLEMGAGLTEREKNQLKAIIKASFRGANLTNSMLAFSRKQKLRPVVTYLDEQISEMLDMLRRTIGETVEIEYEADPDLWACTTDPGQVESAVLNMALNARDAMPNGGHLLIKTGNIAYDTSAIGLDGPLPSGEYVFLSVADTGTGIDKNDIEHVFEPFFTTKDVGKGTGLGLSMVYGFIKQSEGHIGIDSEKGQGTTITLYLPKTETEDT
ncbi:MAG: PAS domain S-box protein [Sneathiellales bacterium]|nr:PAS domain S-box protein [Sneathiellales bacterium]